MSFAEDLNGFFADFGVDATFGAETAKVIFDEPDEIIADGQVISSSYTIKYKTGLFSGLSYGDSIVVDGVTYTCDTVQKIEDGKMSMATLSGS
jgi:riboflavin synthase alpha subunit